LLQKGQGQEQIMYFRGPKFVREQLIEYLNRVLLQTPSWTNTGIDVIKLPGNVGSLGRRIAISQFAFEEENYPSVLVYGQGGRKGPMGFNNYVGTARPQTSLGVVGDGYLAVDDSNAVVQQLPQSFISGGIIAQGAELQLKSAGGMQDAVTVGLGYTSGTSTITYVTTGSVIPEDNNDWQKLYIPFEATASLISSQKPWVLGFWTSGSAYLIMTDSSSDIRQCGITSDRTTVPSWVQKDVVCNVLGPQSVRFGGAEELIMGFKVQSMNDTDVADNLADLVKLYLELARYMSVDVDQTDSLFAFDKTGVIANAVGELHALGIFVGDVSRGPEGQRPRGENDVVHFREITCTVRCEWGKDVGIDELKSIDSSFTSQSS
jgi:hypothetical protein